MHHMLAYGAALGLAFGLALCYIYGRQKDRSWALALEAVNRSWRDAKLPAPQEGSHLRLVK